MTLLKYANSLIATLLRDGQIDFASGGSLWNISTARIHRVLRSDTILGQPPPGVWLVGSQGGASMLGSAGVGFVYPPPSEQDLLALCDDVPSGLRLSERSITNHEARRQMPDLVSFLELLIDLLESDGLGDTADLERLLRACRNSTPLELEIYGWFPLEEDTSSSLVPGRLEQLSDYLTAMPDSVLLRAGGVELTLAQNAWAEFMLDNLSFVSELIAGSAWFSIPVDQHTEELIIGNPWLGLVPGELNDEQCLALLGIGSYRQRSMIVKDLPQRVTSTLSRFLSRVLGVLQVGRIDPRLPTPPLELGIVLRQIWQTLHVEHATMTVLALG